jgi:hypothetical protein
MRSETLLLFLVAAPCSVQSVLQKPALLADAAATCLTDSTKLNATDALKTVSPECTKKCGSGADCLKSSACVDYEAACKDVNTNGWGWWCIAKVDITIPEEGTMSISTPQCFAPSCSGCSPNLHPGPEAVKMPNIKEGVQTMDAGKGTKVTLTCHKNAAPTWFIIVMVLLGVFIITGVAFFLCRRQGYAKV